MLQNTVKVVLGQYSLQGCFQSQELICMFSNEANIGEKVMTFCISSERLCFCNFNTDAQSFEAHFKYLFHLNKIQLKISESEFWLD